MLGLCAQPARRADYSADAATATSVATWLGMHPGPEGLLAAGTPVSTPAASWTGCRPCPWRTRTWLLLYSSLQWRGALQPRGCEWQHVRPAIQRAEDRAVGDVFAILEVPGVNSRLTEQTTLPLRQGGLSCCVSTGTSIPVLG
jgi:hypothetical protein